MIDAKQVEKYVEALNNILGADNAYFRGDKDVDTIVELIQTVKSLNDERETMLKDLQFRTNQVVEQQAEIERLEKELSTATNHITRLENQIERLLPMLKTKRAEAIKEFAERLKEHLKGNGGLYCVTTMNAKIDILVKEMAGDDK